MRIDALSSLSRRPPSEVEWEDLLVRIELMPRALRFALEEMEPTESGVGEVLDDLVAREEGARVILEQAAGIAPPGATVPASDGKTFATHADRVDRFVRSRTRNFAIVQRRGIDVWDWEAPAGADVATIYQLLTHLAREDVAALAAIRRAAAGSRDC